MQQSRGHILWVDDEIDHLKPHILFLEEKGYSLTSVTNGPDALKAVREHPFHLVLLDHFMPGMDGMETLRRLKEIKPSLPVIMITKSEEEWLMNEAISEQVAHFLIKPVNPTQIFMACKQVLEKTRIREEHATSGYLKDFQEIEQRISGPLEIDDWWQIYNRLVTWQLSFDEHKDLGLGNILTEQIQSSNREFVRFVEDNYLQWLQGEEGPVLSPHVLPHFLFPELEQGQKLCFILVDGLRHDQFMALAPELRSQFDLDVEFQVSILPSATPFSRNAIFSGLFPVEFCRRYPQQIADMRDRQSGFNRYEEQFLNDLLKRKGLGDLRYHYHKISSADDGLRFQGHIGEYLHLDFLAVVVNFVDLLAHKRSESDILKEMLPDESGYRFAVRTWFENSWLYRLLRDVRDSGFTIILTSDHGSIRVHRGVLVGADRETSTGIRYKYGRNLNCREKNALLIRKPQQYLLPEIVHQTNYIVAKDDVFFLYPNQQHRYESVLDGSFQHGGISLEEMLVPVAILRER
jgi:CheY-like chemotaxis protein